jgi:hypothetical protein
MDLDLRNSLWNEISSSLSSRATSHDWPEAAQVAAQYHYKIPAETAPTTIANARGWLREQFLGAKWHAAYDFVEFFSEHLDFIVRDPFGGTSGGGAEFVQRVNIILERELSGYRFINGTLAPISDPAEIHAIEQASQAVAGAGLHGAHEHITNALRLLGMRPKADYRNSIKESISAVESVVKQCGGSQGGGVDGAVERLAAKTEIHGALKSAIKQLFGYTSDENGIRHAILDQSEVGFDEAKFMLVTCSAFVNFFVSKASKAGLLPLT